METSPTLAAEIVAILAFSLAVAITPGPNNALLAATGATVGFRRTLPLIGGIMAGVATLFLAAAFGLQLLFAALPQAAPVLRVAGVAVLLWLSWRIARAPLPGGDRAARPAGFVTGYGLQFLNPKALAFAVSAIAGFGGGAIPNWGIALLMLAPGGVSALVWSGLGAALSHWIGADAVRWRVAAVTLGLLTAATALWMAVPRHV